MPRPPASASPGSSTCARKPAPAGAGRFRCASSPPDKGIAKLASVEDVLGLGGGADEAALGLGSRYRIDYDVLPLRPDGDTVDTLARIPFPAGTRLTLRFSLEFPLPRDTKLYLSYARSPRLLHQALLRR